MSIRMRRPATARLELSQGDSLIVKQDLTAGEYRELLRGSSKWAPTLELDPLGRRRRDRAGLSAGLVVL